MALKQNLRYLLEIVAALILSYIAGIAKVMYAFVYKNIFLFNLLGLLVYGSFSFLIGYFSKWKTPKFTAILILVFIVTSLFVIGQILAKVYITKELTYPSYEWMASALIIPFAAFIGGLLSKLFICRKQNA